jgi:hypothetical protein
MSARAISIALFVGLVGWRLFYDEKRIAALETRTPAQQEHVWGVPDDVWVQRGGSAFTVYSQDGRAWSPLLVPKEY